MECALEKLEFIAKALTAVCSQCADTPHGAGKILDDIWGEFHDVQEKIEEILQLEEQSDEH